MKNYYLEQVHKCEAKVELAKIGYATKLCELATDLASADVMVCDLIIDQINDARMAFNDLREELKGYQQRYQKELEKEEANNDED